jgi:crotonobetainyl-CoA:carnitine CoA-transferase CaiB-like acyl-CoA transferase
MTPLEGLKVLDLTRILAGPWATQMLADLGADVIKLERPGSGDDTRGWGPPFLKAKDGTETAEAAYYLSVNRGKRSLALDITAAEGAAIAQALAARADVVMENFKFGGLAKYGLDYASLSKLNPGLVYCSITGFGQTGPDREKPGYDAMIQAKSGLMSINGPADDEPGAGPQKVGVAVSDLFAGFYAITAVQAALLQRARTGQGQHIDIALYDCQIAALANQAMNYLVSGEAPVRMGTAHPNLVPYQVFPTADGFLMVAVGNDAQFQRLAGALERPDIADDPRFAKNRGRVEHRAVLIGLLTDSFKTRTTADWRTALNKGGIPNGPVQTLDQVFADPQVEARGLQTELDHPLSGKLPHLRCPIAMSGAEISSGMAPPLLGQHTVDVLKSELDFDDQRIAALVEQGVIEQNQTGSG